MWLDGVWDYRMAGYERLGYLATGACSRGLWWRVEGC